MPDGLVQLANSQTDDLATTTGGLNSLMIDENSDVDLRFDAELGSDLDWGLRLAGDQQDLLQNYIGSGRLTFSGSTAPIGVIYDAFRLGDFSYVAAGTGVTSAVPEPSSMALLGMIGVVGLLRRKDKCL